MRKTPDQPTITLHSNIRRRNRLLNRALMMNFGQRTRTPIPPEATDFAELLRLIRSGHGGAANQLRRVLTPGVRFLLRRRLGRNDVDREARTVLDRAIQAIQADVAVRQDGVPRMVRALIQQQCTAEAGPASQTAAGMGPTAAVQAGLLDGMSPVEREALRRCYVLGEAPESFLTTLKLTPQEFRAIRARARAEFSSRKAQANVA